MDLSKILWGLVAFGIGLAIGGCLELSALFIGFCILFGAYFIATAILNGLQNHVEQMQQQEEERRPIGFPTNYVQVGEDE